MPTAPTDRILVIDDNADIHADFRRILARTPSFAHADALDALESELFDAPAAAPREGPAFEIDSAMQGQEGLERVVAALSEGRPYALAFVDMRMPPGWDGLRTCDEILKRAPDLRLVICSAYSDRTPEEIRDALGVDENRLQFRAKPFAAADILRLARQATAGAGAD